MWSLFLCTIFSFSLIFQSDDFGGDDGGGGGDLLDMESMMGPSGVGGGSDGNGLGMSSNKAANLRIQTLLAIQEFGIVLAVACMVGCIFFLMISIEKLFDNMVELYQKRFGDYKEEDIEDPAALVGTFKRYKN